MIKSIATCKPLLDNLAYMTLSTIINLFDGKSAKYFESNGSVNEVKATGIWALMKTLLKNSCVFLGVNPTAISLSYSAGACMYNTIYSDSIQGL